MIKHFYVTLLVTVLINSLVFAEGSKDLYPNGISGGRAYLFSNTASPSSYIPFPTKGTHYVYAKAGEQIAIASSAQNSKDKRLFLISPSGTDVTPTGTEANDFGPNATRGKIPNRTGEKAGPLLPGQAAGSNRYTPIYYTVPTNGEGVYRVEFIGTGSNDASYVNADANWTQGGDSRNIAAWDISVAKQVASTWQWENGRVYTNVINFNNPAYSGSKLQVGNGFYGKFKVLTKDGYIYNVDNNGSIGLNFTFMVNNQGFHSSNQPTYKSVTYSNTNNILTKLYNPTAADGNGAINHKIFYNSPSSDLPVSANIELSTYTKSSTNSNNYNITNSKTTTWLKTTPKSLDITNVHFVGAESTPDQLIVQKGGYVYFTSNVSGNFTLKIRAKNASSSFKTRTITGTAIEGENRVFFNGRDNSNNTIGSEEIIMDIIVRYGEVHFPFIDVEMNPNGTIIELLNNDGSVRSDVVYWNDGDFANATGQSNPKNASESVVPNGTSSNANGHKWSAPNSNGEEALSNGFGNDRGMDTWAYLNATSPAKEVRLSAKQADLKIEHVEANTAWVKAGDKITYTVVVKNDGPDAVTGGEFNFVIPGCFSNVATSISATTNGATESAALSYSGGTYTSVLNMPNQATITYSIQVQVGDCGSLTSAQVEASILRTSDFYDPDATNMTVPGSGYYIVSDVHNECSGACNNIYLKAITHSPLPIELISFNASCNDKGVELNWQTATETNVSHFEILRTRDGQTWNLISQVNAVGNSTKRQSYSTVDKNGFETVYYKLRSVDNDGTFKDSKIISIICDGIENTWSIYPIPVSNEATISVFANESFTTDLVITNMEGKIVTNNRITIEKGHTTMQLSSNELAAGVYIARFANNNYLPIKFVKVD